MWKKLYEAFRKGATLPDLDCEFHRGLLTIVEGEGPRQLPAKEDAAEAIPNSLPLQELELPVVPPCRTVGVQCDQSDPCRCSAGVQCDQSVPGCSVLATPSESVPLEALREEPRVDGNVKTDKETGYGRACCWSCRSL